MEQAPFQGFMWTICLVSYKVKLFSHRFLSRLSSLCEHMPRTCAMLFVASASGCGNGSSRGI